MLDGGWHFVVEFCHCFLEWSDESEFLEVFRFAVEGCESMRLFVFLFGLLVFYDDLFLENVLLVEVDSLPLCNFVAFLYFMLEGGLECFQFGFLSDVVPEHFLLLGEFGGSR